MHTVVRVGALLGRQNYWTSPVLVEFQSFGMNVDCPARLGRITLTVDEVSGKRAVCIVKPHQDGLAEDFFALAGFGTKLQEPSRACLFGHNVLHPRTGHTTEPVKIPYGLPLTTNYIHDIRDINTIGTVLQATCSSSMLK
jgi:hypothetical protein